MFVQFHVIMACLEARKRLGRDVRIMFRVAGGNAWEYMETDNGKL